MYWLLVLKIQLTILLLVRSLREGQFRLYKEATRNLLPCFFALDKVNYARWLTVHLHDMIRLDQTCPSVKQKFEEGSFGVRKTQRKFFAKNSAQLLRWMVSGPEIARLITEFESIQDAIRTNQSKGPDVHHHK